MVKPPSRGSRRTPDGDVLGQDFVQDKCAGPQGPQGPQGSARGAGRPVGRGLCTVHCELRTVRCTPQGQGGARASAGCRAHCAPWTVHCTVNCTQTGVHAHRAQGPV